MRFHKNRICKTLIFQKIEVEVSLRNINVKRMIPFTLTIVSLYIIKKIFYIAFPHSSFPPIRIAGP